jgi:hypothetical protein
MLQIRCWVAPTTGQQRDGLAVNAIVGVNRRRGLTSVRRPILTMGACSNLQILIEKCR